MILFFFLFSFLFQQRKNDPRPDIAGLQRQQLQSFTCEELLGWLLITENLARQVEQRDTEVRTELVRETLHPSAASTAPNNNTVILLHGFSDFCQEMGFTTHWPIKHKHWIRATLATLCFSEHKQESDTTDCCTRMRNQNSHPAWNTRQDRPSPLSLLYCLSTTAYFSRENKNFVLDTQERILTNRGILEIFIQEIFGFCFFFVGLLRFLFFKLVKFLIFWF